MGSKRKSSALTRDREQPSAIGDPAGNPDQKATPQEIVPAELTRVFMGEVFDAITQRLHDQIWASSKAFRQALEGPSDGANKASTRKRRATKNGARQAAGKNGQGAPEKTRRKRSRKSKMNPVAAPSAKHLA
jgi:hypothetical protein